MKLRLGLQVQHKSHLKKPLMVELFIRINLDGMSSLTYSSIPPPYSFQSNLKVKYPSILNCIVGTESSNLISVIIKTSHFYLTPQSKFIANRTDIDMCENEVTYIFPTTVIQMLTKLISSFEVLSLGSLKKLSPFVVEKHSFDLALKPSKDSD